MVKVGGGGGLMARPPVYNGQGCNGFVKSSMAANVENRRTDTQSGRHADRARAMGARPLNPGNLSTLVRFTTWHSQHFLPRIARHTSQLGIFIARYSISCVSTVLSGAGVCQRAHAGTPARPPTGRPVRDQVVESMGVADEQQQRTGRVGRSGMPV